MSHCIMHKLFTNKCFKNCKNMSTDGKVMSKIKVASFFLGHGVDEFTLQEDKKLVITFIINHN